jgi:hypothetical protein
MQVIGRRKECANEPGTRRPDQATESALQGDFDKLKTVAELLSSTRQNHGDRGLDAISRRQATGGASLAANRFLPKPKMTTKISLKMLLRPSGYASSVQLMLSLKDKGWNHPLMFAAQLDLEIVETRSLRYWKLLA